MKIAAGFGGVLLLVLVLAQLFLGAVAGQRVRDRVAHFGTVQSVQVHAFPAIKLLWNKADSIKVKAQSLRVGLAQVSSLLASAHGVNELDFAATKVQITSASLSNGGLALHNVSLHKRGANLSGSGSLSKSDMRTAMPGFDIQPVASGGGEVQVRATGALFGIQTSVMALVSAQEGKLVVQPIGIPLAGLARLTLFSDPRVSVQGISASPQSGGYLFTVKALLR